jgi:hypothetical protein
MSAERHLTPFAHDADSGEGSECEQGGPVMRLKVVRRCVGHRLGRSPGFKTAAFVPSGARF